MVNASWDAFEAKNEARHTRAPPTTSRCSGPTGRASEAGQTEREQGLRWAIERHRQPVVDPANAWGVGSFVIEEYT